MTRKSSPEKNTAALLFPPFFFNDFRGPYLSLPQLLGFAHGQGIRGIELHDVNAALWDVLLSPEFLGRLIEETDATIRRDPSDTDRVNQRLLLAYLEEDPARLRNDRQVSRMYAGLIFGHYYERVNKDISHQVNEIQTGASPPLADLVVSPAIARLNPDTRLVGLTVPTADQFFPALALAREAKIRFGPDVHVTLGGPIFALLSRPQLYDVLECEYIDSVVLHEGEYSLCGLVEHVSGQRELASVPNLLYRRRSDRISATPVQQAPPLNECPAPRFPSSFLKPYGRRVRLPVWATRGCYWGKCTFCDYVHLSSNNNNAETIRVQKFVDVLEQVGEEYDTDRFEVITECLSPSFSRRLAEELDHRQLEIDWTTHLKVEKKYSSVPLCNKIRRSGCRKVTIGVESFNDRQLEVMKKGCTRDDVVAMLRALTGAGIEATINIIVDFPSVTEEEAEETLEALREYRHLIAGMNVFSFVLSNKTEIAESPEEFGIQPVKRSDVEHNRGFHFSKFERVQGMTEEEAARMLERYRVFSDRHARLVTAERSVDAMRGASLDDIEVRAQPHFLFSDRAFWEEIGFDLARMVGDGHELAFDLVSARLLAIPAGLVALHQALLERGWIPGGDVAELVTPEPGESAADDFAFSVVKACVYFGLLEVRCEQLQLLRPPKHAYEAAVGSHGVDAHVG